MDELSIIYSMDKRDVRARLKDVRPTGVRGDMQYWALRTASQYLMPISDKDAETVDRILRLHPNALPKILAKEYWAGQLARLNVLSRQNHLWDSEAVIDLASTAFRTIRQGLMLLPDAMERETGLTEPQRLIVKDRVEAVLETLRETLVDEFVLAREQFGSGKAFASEEAAPEEVL